jgi:hypothetical protein
MPEMPFGAPRVQTGISYLTRWGWANDWVTRWTSTNAWIRWEIEVVTPGDYEVTLRYTCPEADAGSRIQVSAGGRSLESRVERAFDPPLYPDRDRYPRKVEVHEKDWAVLKAGVLHLERGVTRLEVRALDIPGHQVMDLLSVNLRLSSDGGAPEAKSSR